MAPEGAGWAADHPSTLGSGTSSARTWPRRCGCPLGGGGRSSRRGPRPYIQGACMGAAAFVPQAITSGQKQKPAPTSSTLEDHRHRLITKHWPWSIFTRYSALQFRHQRIRWLALVSELACWVVMPLQLGQTYRPFFMASLTRSLQVCNRVPSLSFVCAYRSTRFQDCSRVRARQILNKEPCTEPRAIRNDIAGIVVCPKVVLVGTPPTPDHVVRHID